VSALLVVAALAFAALLGVSDAPNASAALIAARTGTYSGIAVWSVVWHMVGGVLAASAVARTMVEMVHVGPARSAPVLASACLTAVAFTWVTTRRGLPTSASVALVGGLAGAGVAAGGVSAVEWGGLAGVRLIGVFGVLFGILLAPVLAELAAWGAGKISRRSAAHLRRSARRGVHGALWVASAAVGLADGTNDGQKAMGILAVAVSGGGTLGAVDAITLWERLVCALVLALGTVIGGHRVVARVSRGLGRRSGAVDDLAAQSTSAGIILLAAGVGLPLSTSTVVTSAMVGSGMAARRRHVRWSGVASIFVAWVLTVPACALVAAGLFEILWRLS